MARGLEYELARGAVLNEIEELGSRTATLPQSPGKAHGVEACMSHTGLIQPIYRHHLPEEEEARVTLRQHPAPLDFIGRQCLSPYPPECRRQWVRIAGSFS